MREVEAGKAQLHRRQVHLALEQRKDRKNRLAVGVVEKGNAPQHGDHAPLVGHARRCYLTWVSNSVTPGTKLSHAV
jgi:hypothetical protein